MIFVKEIGLFDNLNRVDLEFLIRDLEVDLINKIFEALKDSEKYDYYYQDGFYFSDKVMEYTHNIISEKLAEIIRKANENDRIAFLRLELLMSIDIDVLLPLLNDKNINLLHRILEIKFSEKYDIYEFYYNFFDKFNEEISKPLREFLDILLINKNYRFIQEFLEDNLLDKLNYSDFNGLIEDPKLNFIETIIQITRNLDPKESYFLYGSPFNNKLLNYGRGLIKKRLFEMIHRIDNDDIISIIRLKLIQCFNVDELTILLHRPEINLLECLLKVKAYFFEDVEDWFQSFFKEMGKSISSSVKNMITDYIEMDDLEELSNFFDFEIVSYLNENDKKDLCKFLKTNENYYQKRSSFEREYFFKILEQIS